MLNDQSSLNWQRAVRFNYTPLGRASDLTKVPGIKMFLLSFLGVAWGLVN